MDWLRDELGPLRFIGTTDDGVTFSIDRTQLELTSDGIVRPYTGLGYSAFRDGQEPFTWLRHNRGHRLVWPLGSATVATYGGVQVWGERYAAWLDDKSISVVDATTSRVARLYWDRDHAQTWRTSASAGVGRLWIPDGTSISSIALADLEALAAGKGRSVDVTIRSRYPRRRPDATLDCVFLWVLQNGDSMLEVGDGRGGNERPKLTMRLPTWAMPKYTPVRLFDQLAPDLWARAEIQGHPGQVQLRSVEPTMPVPAKLKLTAAEHPDGDDRPVATTSDQKQRIAALVASVVKEPDVDQHREVLVDLLQEIEDPAGPVFALARTGVELSPGKKKVALGPLAPYFIDVELRAGLPEVVTLSRGAPRVVVADLLDDFRIGLIRELRIGLGRPLVYTQFVASPKMVLLRSVDVANIAVVDMLIKNQRTQFTRVDHVNFWKPRNLGKLADPTFDNVRTMHASVHQFSANELANVIVANPRKVFTRVPRIIEIVEADGNHEGLRRDLRARRAELAHVDLRVNGEPL